MFNLPFPFEFVAFLQTHQGGTFEPSPTGHDVVREVAHVLELRKHFAEFEVQGLEFAFELEVRGVLLKVLLHTLGVQDGLLLFSLAHLADIVFVDAVGHVVDALAQRVKFRDVEVQQVEFGVFELLQILERVVLGLLQLVVDILFVEEPIELDLGKCHALFVASPGPADSVHLIHLTAGELLVQNSAHVGEVEASQNARVEEFVVVDFIFDSTVVFDLVVRDQGVDVAGIKLGQ
mmetsp:Transcript_70910/g.152793  ORF Transcript_70910/g.152793 Transcript_70910/m.152793 type:complete len:234 (+) Transcript_70910:252-953(+)